MAEEQGIYSTGDAITALPSEILVYIFTFLDSPAPSASRLSDQPTFSVTERETTDLKSISKVSKAWRPSALRLLLRHARFLLEYELDAPRPSLNALTKPPLRRHRGDELPTHRPPAPLQPPPLAHPPPQRRLLPPRIQPPPPPPRHSPTHPSSLFNLRPWRTLLLNEGSFLRAFSPPSRHIHRPPSLLPSLLGARAPHPRALLPSTIRSLSYTAFFPFWPHFAQLLQHLPRLERLHLQLTPVGAADLLPDPWLRGVVDVAELIFQRATCYRELLDALVGEAPRGDWRALREVRVGEPDGEEGHSFDVTWAPKARERVGEGRAGWRWEGGGVLRRERGWEEPLLEGGARSLCWKRAGEGG
ncbi:hypothetical protein MMC13_003787 [Lambiella insularis]|nr:hypothetical protein [Lambiella insularis]